MKRLNLIISQSALKNIFISIFTLYILIFILRIVNFTGFRFCFVVNLHWNSFFGTKREAISMVSIEDSMIKAYQLVYADGDVSLPWS